MTKKRNKIIDREDSDVDVVNCYDRVVDEYLQSYHNKRKNKFKDMIIKMITRCPTIDLSGWQIELDKLMGKIDIQK